MTDLTAAARPSELIAVTGATGALGGRVARRLAERGIAQRLVVRDAGRAPRIVYTSFLGAAPDSTFTLARHHHATEEAIRATGLAWTFLRDSFYLDYVPFCASADGVIAGPAGEGRTGWVARDDVADVAVVALTEEGHEGRTYDVTGGESCTFAYAAEVLSEVSGGRVTYKAETLEEA